MDSEILKNIDNDLLIGLGVIAALVTSIVGLLNLAWKFIDSIIQIYEARKVRHWQLSQELYKHLASAMVSAEKFLNNIPAGTTSLDDSKEFAESLAIVEMLGTKEIAVAVRRYNTELHCAINDILFAVDGLQKVKIEHAQISASDPKIDSIQLDPTNMGQSVTALSEIIRLMLERDQLSAATTVTEIAIYSACLTGVKKLIPIRMEIINSVRKDMSRGQLGSKDTQFYISGESAGIDAIQEKYEKLISKKVEGIEDLQMRQQLLNAISAES